MDKKTITVITPCYNEEANIVDVCREIRNVFAEIPDYNYEHVFIDNASTDGTLALLRGIAAEDEHVKVIVCVKNFGPVRSHYHALREFTGDAMIYYMCDLQEPPSTIKEFVKKWEEGYKIVLGIKKSSRENPIMFQIRRLYYRVLQWMSETGHFNDFMSFGLYDKAFIDVLKTIDDPYPYFRGQVAEFGYDIAQVPYAQNERKKGKSTNNLYSLYGHAMLGFINQSKVPLRLACFVGFSVALLSLLIAFVYFVMKLMYWDTFQMGIAPLVIGLFFFSSVQLFFIGIIGEYIGAIFTHVKKKPMVIERERINFD
ncbi:MAG: glycosyltransferase family 2 protein [Gammaproteobacteria bacterium]|mgnify:CR=1 FL=1|nr:glycosyltransferase family 2 protein [Gammaproteobacteria bacterium]MBT4491723.1 glycosyltransferase family 2 protein [Gammaproteobacteria bacterium]MBT7370581.1 glycosyltransferase family 2 protein [Gammaproteobacteria bacterium]